MFFWKKILHFCSDGKIKKEWIVIAIKNCFYYYNFNWEILVFQKKAHASRLAYLWTSFLEGVESFSLFIMGFFRFLQSHISEARYMFLLKLCSLVVPSSTTKVQSLKNRVYSFWDMTLWKSSIISCLLWVVSDFWNLIFQKI